MQRRSFIKKAGAFSLPVMLNGLGLSAFAKPFLFDSMDENSDKVLVLIQLNGGNDGLNMVIPLDQYDNLYKARPKLAVPVSVVLPLTDKAALHPTMKGLSELYQEGKMGVAQAVGYPNANRSHFRSMEIWSTGSPSNEIWNTGWLGRYLDTQAQGYPEGYPNEQYPHPFAITMGYSVSSTCQGKAANLSMTLIDPFTLIKIPEGTEAELEYTRYAEELAFLRHTIDQTNDYSKRIVDAANVGKNLVAYPNSDLAKQLKNIALLISGGLQTKIYVASLGGFDTHADQADEGSNGTKGKHATLLNTVSDAIKAFQDDLKALGVEKRVFGMTYSEFGRQIKANESIGTDHGDASPLIFFGACANATVVGNSPVIPANVKGQEGVEMQVDIRNVYGSVLMDWFGVQEEDVKTMLHQEFQHLPIIDSACAVTSSVGRLDELPIEIGNYPNPFAEFTEIRFDLKESGWIRLEVLDVLGQQLERLVDKTLGAGEHRLRFDAYQLPAGTYFYRIMMNGKQKTMRMVKVSN